ncbi:unnamed protein product [Dibothriocephalus latus]|uniref:Uncharacterized protein n=1 Tax=Dibothriocephalus latus TaxID=60516 RepID=A0A3P6U3H5_DIBLA|nr:unnamed protein product [Dibothriocephalus latus]
MAAQCAQIHTPSEHQKPPKVMSNIKATPPPKNICQPFTLRLILGVPILKEDNKVASELARAHIVIGVNAVVKRLEDSARDNSYTTTDFAVVFLDFAWLNSQLGHHLAHLCSTTPHTSLVAVSPPGKLAQILSSPKQTFSRVACIGVRPLFAPHTSHFPRLHECLKICSSLAGKPLPPDPATGCSANVALAMPQYVPILPKPTTTNTSGLSSMPQLSSFLTQAPQESTPTILPAKALSQSSVAHTQISKAAQGPPKPTPPRPAVRHIPADDWLTYKLDHAKLYKCGSDISKELEDHSLYIHDVADIWGLYPRHFQKLETRRPPMKKIKAPKAPSLPPPPPPPPPTRKQESGYSDAYLESPRRLTREERMYRKQLQIQRRSRHNPRRSPRSYASRMDPY